MDLQHGIIRGHRLECDICMPTSAGETARVAELMCHSTSLLLLHAADDADLVAEFAAFLCKRVHMETGRLGLGVLQYHVLGAFEAQRCEKHLRCQQERKFSHKGPASVVG